jgi:hypothetical protein
MTEKSLLAYKLIVDEAKNKYGVNYENKYEDYASDTKT